MQPPCACVAGFPRRRLYLTGVTIAAAQTPPRELPAYAAAIVCYFVGFGIQMVLFPYLIANTLGASPQAVGVAQAAGQLPLLVLLLWGGVAAERAPTRAWLVGLHALAATPALGLAALIAADQLSYAVMLGFGAVMGALTAFLMPARDAALNGVVARDTAAGRSTDLQKSIAAVTAAQLGAQVVGMTLAGFAGAAPVEALLCVQAGAFGLAALFCLRLARREPAKPRSGRNPIAEIREGLSLTLRHDVLLPMVLIGLYVGVFIIGSFSVLFPLMIRDEFALGAQALSAAFVAFWTGSFLSSIVLSRRAAIVRPGRALLFAQAIGAAALASFAIEKPFALFLASVFLWGLAAGVAFAMSRTIVQEAAPAMAIARVLAIYSLGFMGGAPIGAALMGLSAEVLGVRMAALVPAIGLLVGIALVATRTPIWRLARGAEGATAVA